MSILHKVPRKYPAECNGRTKPYANLEKKIQEYIKNCLESPYGKVMLIFSTNSDSNYDKILGSVISVSDTTVTISLLDNLDSINTYESFTNPKIHFSIKIHEPYKFTDSIIIVDEVDDIYIFDDI